MPQLVEDAGGEWYASVQGKWCRIAGTISGERQIGNRRIVWTLAPGDAVAVTHPGMSGDAESQSYSIRLDPLRIPSGGWRWYWLCPECSRRVEVLYLPAGRERLACRRCCGLTYRSQSRRGKVDQRKDRPGIITSVYRWEWDAVALRTRLVYRRGPELRKPNPAKQRTATILRSEQKD